MLGYAVTLLLPVALTLAAVGLNLLFGAQRLAEFRWPDFPSTAARFLFILVWIGLGEEPGWRGFALPRLLERRPALSAALIVGLAHLAWHLPLFCVEYGPADLLPWGITVVCFSIVITWVFLNTGGSVLMAILMHAANNTVAVAWRMFEGADGLRLWWIWCALWVAVALAVVLAGGLATGRRGEPGP